MAKDFSLNECDYKKEKRSLIKKASQVAGSTMLGKIFGIVREITLSNFLGLGAMSDAFIIAFKIPNTLRLLFAEGALSAALVPSVVESIKKNGINSVNKLITLAFLVFEGLLLIVCLLAIWNASIVIKICAPGFTPEKAAFCTKLLKILMPFIFFISSNALISGPLQAVGHFFIPAISQVIFNVFFVTSILTCTYFNLPIDTLCYLILLTSFFLFILHVFTYFRLGFSIEKSDIGSNKSFWDVIKKFIPCLFSMSIVEVDAFIDTSFGSWLPDGSISLINYAERFMSIPLSVFGIAFATIMLPYFSKIISVNPKRIKLFILESSKLVFWAALPLIITMIFLSTEIFSTLFSKKFSLAQSTQAGNILIAYLFAALFFSLNKILLNVFYAFHSIWTPTIISIVGVAVNFVMDWTLIKIFSSVGLAMATTASAFVQSILYIILLNKTLNIKFCITKFLNFLIRYVLQLCVTLSIVFLIYKTIYNLLGKLPEPLSKFLLIDFGFWLWVIPLELLLFLFIYKTRKFFGIKLYFIDQN